MTGLAIDQCSKTFEILSIESEARRICDERGITDFDSYGRMCLALGHRRFIESIQPYLSMKIRLHNMRMLDRIVIHENGTTNIEYKPLPPDALTAPAQIDEMIAREATRWGLPTAPSRT